MTARSTAAKLTVAQRDLMLRLAAAGFGLAVAIALLPVWSRPAPPGQLPGYMTYLKLDAHGPMRFIAGLMVLPPLFAFLFAPLARRLSGDDIRSWARNGIVCSTLVSLTLAAFVDRLAWVAAPFIVTTIACYGLRRLRARFSRRDTILLPAILTTYFASIDLLPSVNGILVLLIVAAMIFALRMVAAVIIASRAAGTDEAGQFCPALVFAFSPLGLCFQTQLSSPHERHLGWPSLAIALLSPLLMGLFVPLTRSSARRLLAAIALVIYPLTAYAYPLATSAWLGEGKPRTNFFEAGHSLLPASEMLRGEKAYRDILPAHGLVEDGFLDYLALRFRGETMGDAVKTHTMTGLLTTVATYATGLAATGSPEAGILALFFATALPTAGLAVLRTVLPLFALALMLRAVRKRSSRSLLGAGFLTGLSVLVSLDFAAYSLLTLCVVCVQLGSTWRIRAAALRTACIGIAAAIIPSAIALGAAGILIEAVRSTLFEVLTLAPVYSIGFFRPPSSMAAMRYFPDVAVAFLHEDSLFYGVWLVAVLIAAAAFSSKRLWSSRRFGPLITLSVFITLTAVSYAERNHLYDNVVAPAFLVLGVWMLFRSRTRSARLLAPAGVIVLLILARMTIHFSVITQMRTAHGPVTDTVAEITDLPRAKGILFEKADVVRMTNMRRYLDTRLTPGETYFDFTNRCLTYFLLNRNCPIRQYEVAFYESESAQREVIERLKRRDVRVALMPASDLDGTVDWIPNKLRAPLVWSYLEANFTPDYDEGGVVFWKRK